MPRNCHGLHVVSFEGTITGKLAKTKSENPEGYFNKIQTASRKSALCFTKNGNFSNAQVGRLPARHSYLSENEIPMEHGNLQAPTQGGFRCQALPLPRGKHVSLPQQRKSMHAIRVYHLIIDLSDLSIFPFCNTPSTPLSAWQGTARKGKTVASPVLCRLNHGVTLCTSFVGAATKNGQ